MKKISIISIYVAYSFSLGLLPVYAYDQNTTHPALTDQIVEFYNASFPADQLTLQQKEWVIQGSIEEDESPRWINHFYDPVHNTGWTGSKTGSIPADVVRALQQIGIINQKPVASVNWIGDEISQSQYLRYGGDFTWARGLRAVAEGDEERTYKTLGHALHLVEDATVPDHTRDDTHAQLPGDDGSPYETYTTRYARGNFKLAAQLTAHGIAPDTSFTTIQDAIKKAAEYSNHYFFSKDTINDPKYESPKITREDEEFGYGTDETGKEFPLVKIKYTKNGSNLEKRYQFIMSEENYPILEAYFSRLSKKSLTVGAGVVRLFQKQKADAIVNKDYPVHIAYYDPEKLVLIPSFSALGEYEKAKTATVNATAYVVKTLSDWYTGIKTTLAGIFPSPQPASVADALPHVLLPPPPITSAAPATPTPQNTNPSSQKKTTLQKNPFPVTQGIVKGDFIQAPQQPPQPQAQQNDATQAPQSIALLAPSGGVTTLFAGSTVPNPEVTIGSTGGGNGGDGGGTLQAPPQWKVNAEFSSSTLSLNLSWTSVPTASASSSMTYQIFDDSVSVSSPIATTTQTEAMYKLQEVGRPYNLHVVAIDENEVVQQQATTTITVPGLFKVFSLYPDIRRGKNPSSTVLEIAYDTQDFLPHLVRPGSRQGLMLFRNQNPVEIPVEITTQISIPNSAALLSLQGKTCIDQNTQTTKTIFILPFSTTTNCQNSGDPFVRSALVVQTKGNHFIVPVATTITDSDFVTVALYEEGENPATPKFIQTIKDVTHYTRASAPPPHESPTAVELQATLNLVRNTIKTTWSATTDPDSLDGDIRYQVQLTTSTISESAWQDAGTANAASLPINLADTHFIIAVRAQDEFGSTSAPSAKDLAAPDGFVPYIQSGSLNSARQEFIVSQDADISSLSLWTNNFTTDSRNPATNVCSLEILDVESTSTQSQVVAVSDTPNPQDGESNAYQYRGHGCAGDLTFTFAGHPRLLAGHRYAWFFHVVLPITLPIYRPGHGEVQFFGTTQNTAGGVFSDTTITNAKFTLTSPTGTVFEN